MLRSLTFTAALPAVLLAISGCGSRTGLYGASGAGGSGGGATTTTAAGCGQCAAAITCAGKGLDCGVVGDGCGCLLDCGTCSKPDEVCGGSGVPNVCGNGCSASSCASLGLDCGLTGDGCDGSLDCGTCPAGLYCGGGPGPNTCGTGPCKTCADLGANCGIQDDGCGNAIDCGTCPAGTVCNPTPGGKPGVCGVPDCAPKSCQDQGFDCGQATDGCGGIIDCGFCSGNQICGEKAPNACGASGACTGLCLQQVACPGGATTSVTGTVYAPNGTDPLYGVLVYVPNAPLQPFPSTVTCGDCTAQVTGAPLVSAVTGADGTFTLHNMPVGANIPLVIQNGRWRRQVTISNVPACTTTALPLPGDLPIRMPRTKAEGDIPLMAFVTGFVDAIECVMRKIGIDDSEFSDPGGSGRVRLYQGLGAPGAAYSSATPTEDQLWGSQAAIDAYDMVYFACQGMEYPPPDAAKSVMINYANAGGRIFATHYAYVWLAGNGPFDGTAAWNGSQSANFVDDPGTGIIDTTFPKGLALAGWLKGLYPASTLGQIPLSTLRHDFDSVVPPSQNWITIDDPGYPSPVPMHYTFDTPVGVPASQQCGRVLFSDFHVEDAMTQTSIFPQECSNGPMTPQEKMLEFMIFDLGSCVALEVCKNAKTCDQQSVTCGPVGDGCGNVLQCGTCPQGEVCVSGQCTTACTPRSCQDQGYACGAQSDGCSGEIQCGSCPPGEACLSGQCGVGPCTPKTCADLGLSCGPQGDGCGGLVECGTCPSGETCVAGHCQTPGCTPRTCADQGFDCGLASDGCDHTIDCGSCTAPSVCGGGQSARPNVCGI